MDIVFFAGIEKLREKRRRPIEFSLSERVVSPGLGFEIRP